MGLGVDGSILKGTFWCELSHEATVKKREEETEPQKKLSLSSTTAKLLIVL